MMSPEVCRSAKDGDKQENETNNRTGLRGRKRSNYMNNNISTAAMTADQRSKCHAIIHTASASAAAAGAGLAQLPGSDNAVITPIQLAMTVSLGAVFGIQLTQSAAAAALASFAASTVGRAASQLLLGWIPGLGNAINAATAATLTESVGWLLAEEFAGQSRAD